MKLSKTGTARFAAVVEAAGKPEVISLWTKPERDKQFMAAVRQNRVMTIKQATVGSAKDFGVVGFLREKNSSFLVFPQSLQAFKDRRIIGIRYDRIQTPGPIGRIIKPGTTKDEKRNEHVQPGEWEPTPATLAREAHPPKHKKHFKVKVRFIATAEVVEQLKADSKKRPCASASSPAGFPPWNHHAQGRESRGWLTGSPLVLDGAVSFGKRARVASNLSAYRSTLYALCCSTTPRFAAILYP